jgi:ATP-dependent protease HslVU (ClpYQ) ATPase subunit
VLLSTPFFHRLEVPRALRKTPLGPEPRVVAAEPENNMIKQQRALLSTEGVDLRFTDDAVMVR